MLHPYQHVDGRQQQRNIPLDDIETAIFIDVPEVTLVPRPRSLKVCLKRVAINGFGRGKYDIQNACY
ncbi:MAG: hypothetical protein GC178_17915 [Flavobacteriales bacterium]|nr:hypothetical protein [Flavobacteriales bacterium]